MRKFLLALAGAALLSGSFAAAQTPPEVIQHYKAYQSALKDGETVKARKAALQAWETAEKILGDNKTTGDLAFNYAQISDQNDVKNPFKNYKKRRKAYLRSVELAKQHKADAELLELERLIKLTELGLTLTKVRKGGNLQGGETSDFNKLKKKIEEFGQKGSVFEGDYEALLSRRYLLKDQNEKAIEHADRAINIYENRSDDLFSAYEYAVRFFKGKSYKNTGDHIPAILEYQHVMQNLEGQLDAEHPFIETAFQNWMLIRSEIEEEGRLDEAELAGLCECWPFENYKNKGVPLLRVPPKMPGNARRSGHVIVQFDVDENGKPINIKELNSSEKIFIKPALKSVEKWLYNKLEDEKSGIERTDITTRISFRLADERGNIIPERGL